MSGRLQPSSGDARSKRRPRQLRSARTEERLLRAAEGLLSRTGTATFSLAALAREAGVSVGGLYRRFPGKGAILVAVQIRIYRKLDREYSTVERAALRADDTLAARLDILVAGIAGLLKRHASAIKAIVEASWAHPVVGRLGLQELAAHRQRFKALLLRHAAEIGHDNPAHALEFCYACIYELVASHFGFGRRVPSERRRWPAFVAELQTLCLAYLTASTRAPRRRRSRVHGG